MKISLRILSEPESKITRDDIAIIKGSLFGVASLTAYYYMAKDNNPSLDGAISGLVAVQIARKQYLTAAFPTFIETYSSFRDWKEGKFMTQKQFLKTAIYVVGFYLGLKKVV